MGIVPTQRRDSGQSARDAGAQSRDTDSRQVASGGDGDEIPRRFRPGTPQRLDPRMLPPELRDAPVGPNVESV